MLAILLTTLVTTAVARAQVIDNESLGLEGARRAVAAVVAEARSKGVGAVVAVVDDGGNLMALERVDGTVAAGAKVSAGKARTAALFKKPTAFFEEVIGKGRTAMTALEDFTPLQGGIPIVVDGQVVGAVGVSGASSARQDEDFALLGTAAVTAPASAVTYIDGGRVAAAFAKGLPLVETDAYRVHASHHDAAGQAEIHTADTDIIYMLEGTATSVTGGSAVEPKVVGDGEIRGSAVQGGDTRRLARGDVMIVPHGVSHGFKQVSAPFNYYVVKVH